MESKLSKVETMELWDKLNNFYKDINSIEDFFMSKKGENIKKYDITQIEPNIFNDFTLEPKDYQLEWGVMETSDFMKYAATTSSQPIVGQIGRSVCLYLKEKTTNKYLGFVRIASPIIGIKPRNTLMGVSKLTGLQVNKHFLNGQSIIPAQPFGFNCLGGKLLALLTCSEEVRQLVNKKYGSKMDLIHMETTSLYGSIKGNSQYDGLEPFIKSTKEMTESDLVMSPTDEVFFFCRDLVRKYYGKVEIGPNTSGPKNKEMIQILTALKVNLLEHYPHMISDYNYLTKTKMKTITQKRYYYCHYGFSNVPDHIKNETPLVEGPHRWKWNFDNMSEWWKRKAQSRYEKLKSEGRLRTSVEVWTENSINNREIDIVR